MEWHGMLGVMYETCNGKRGRHLDDGQALAGVMK